MKKLSVKKNYLLFGVFILLFVVMNVFCIYKDSLVTYSSPVEYLAYNTDEYVYLSDIPYIKEDSYASSSIKLDKNEDKGLIGLKVNNETKYFIKGVTAWATSELVYDLSDYDYDYFTSYLGVDVSEQSDYFPTGVKFRILVSNDKEEWDEVYASKVLYGWSNAEFVKIDIRDVKYLKLVADENKEASGDWWSNWYDEAVYADAKLIKEDYQEKEVSFDFKTVAEYDALLKNYYGQEIEGEYEELLLKREFVNHVGYNQLLAFASYGGEYAKVLSWLVHDIDNLKLYLLGGKPDGSYINSLKVLAELYDTYKEDLGNSDMISNVPLKDVYRKMMISLSLTHSTTVGLWVTGRSENVNDPNESNALVRYQIYKDLLSEGKLDTDVFVNLNVEEMRFVMNGIIDDEEIKWLNDYVREHNSRDPYMYIVYTFGYNYSQSKYYDPDMYATWDAKYHLSAYHITYKQGYPKLFVVFEEGGVCGALSKTGSIIWTSNGVPSSVVSQPGHAAYIVYSKNNDGDGIWTIYNNIFGWAQSGKTEKLNVRMPNGWGSGSYASTWPASYVLLAQAALNEFETYQNAEEILMLANVYADDDQKLEEVYRDALEVENINFDAWLGLVNLYKNTNKDEVAFYNLAEEIASNLRYYPLPMYDLLRLIQPYMKSSEYIAKYNLLLESNLTMASKATSQESIQPSAVKEVANYLLGNTDTDIASFSFDGEHAGEIVLSSKFDDLGVVWEYSLDGKNSWKQTNNHEHLLTSEELASITAENDIAVHIVGTDYSDENIFTIDILTNTIPNNLYNNDLENKVIGVTNTMEWRFDSSDEWIRFSDQLPDLTGNKTVFVRNGATGIYVPSGEKSYSFTMDSNTPERTYISIDHLSIKDVSSEATSNNGYATHAIDGNINTIWHSSYDGSDQERYIVIELDEERYISAIEYTPRQSGSNGRIKDAQVYVSLDNQTWTQVGDTYSFANSASMKAIEFPESVKAKYVKLVATSNYGDGRSFISAAMINLFEDGTKKGSPTAEIQYSIGKLTNLDVVVTLVNPSRDITITNNDGSDTYIFTQNGSFTFEFVDQYGNTGSARAEVTWIDKTAPTATVSYSIVSKTTQPVIATLTDASEDITILNNNGNSSYEFKENESFTFVFQDVAGNRGEAVATVDWIVSEEADNSNDDVIEDIPSKEPSGDIEESKPDNSDNNSTSENNSNEKPIGDEDSTNNDVEHNEQIQTFHSGIFTLNISSELLDSNAVFKVDKLELTDYLKKQLGENSEYYHIYFEDDIDLNSPMTLMIDIKASNLLGVYRLGSANQLEKLDYTKISSNRIEIEVDELGDFVLVYDDVKEDSNVANEIDENNSYCSFMWILGGIVSLSIVIIILRFRKNRR